MPVTPVFRIRTLWSGLAGGDMITTTYFDEGTFSAQVTADKMHGFWTEMAPEIVNDANWTIDNVVDTVDVTTGNITAQTPITPSSGIGQDITPPASAGTQGLLNLFTNVFLEGRQLRGKLYVPGVPTSAIVDEVPSGPYDAELLSAWDTFSTGGIQVPVVYSPTYSQWQPVTAPSPSTRFARIRSRVR